MKILSVNKTTLGLLIAGGLGSCFFLYLTTKVYLKRKRYRHMKGPKTHGISGFYFGNLSELNEARKNNVPFPQKLLEWKQTYGPIFKVQFMNDIIVCVNDPDAIKKIIIDKNLPKYEYLYNFFAYSFNTRMLGKGLLTQIDNESWKKKRSVFNHGFQRSFLMNSLKEFNDNSNFLMEKLRTMADGKTKVVLANEINRMALDIIANVAFGINTNSLTAKSSYLNSTITRLLVYLNDLFEDPLIVYNPLKRGIVKEARKVINELRTYARDHILQRIKDIQNKEPTPNDILTVIINSPGDQIELEELVDDFMTFFIAGQETTANSLAFAVLELGLNKEVFERARNEVDEVLGARPIVTYDDMAKLEYISCVFKETLRKWPPAPEFSRFTFEDLDLNGTIVPRNSWIALSPYVMGRSEEFFPNPDKFQPERFLKGSKENELNKITSYTYFPFSVGPRNCIGQNFAQLEAKIMLVKLIQNFDIKLDPEQSFDPLEMTTLRPKDGCRVFLMPRHT